MPHSPIHYLIIFILLALSKSSIAQISLADSLIAYYPFDGSAIDQTGNGNDGTVFGATLTEDRFGNSNSAYLFNGIDDYIELTAGSKFKPSTFPISVCAWVKANSTNNVTGQIFENELVPDQYTGIFFEDQLQYGGVIAISYGDGGTTGPCCRRSKIGTISTNDDQWHFVAGIIRGPTDMDIYIDCAYDPGFYSGTGDSMVYLGGNGSISKRDVVQGTFYYGGELDDLRFYHRELMLSDLQLLYYTPFPYGNSISTVSLGNDTALCPGSSLILHPIVDGTAVSYLWSDGSTDSTLEVNTNGEFWVAISDGCGITSDTILIGKGYSDPVNLGADTLLCDGQFLILDAGNNYDSYLWSNGAFTENIIVNTSGTYWVTVEGQGCTSTDTINVNFTVCNGNNWNGDNPIKLFYDETNNCISISGQKISYNSKSRFTLYNLLGVRFVDEEIELNEQTTKIFLPGKLAPACYLASIQIHNSVLNVPLIVSH